MKRLTICMIILAALISACSGTRLHEETVTYTSQGVVMKGYLVYNDSITSKRPGILVVHEWWGLNDYARKRARMLAELGFTALAVDMYGEGKQARHPGDAQKFASEVMKNMPAAKARFMAAYDLLKQQPTVDPGRIAAIGYCFGGGVALQMAREGADLKGAVSFHGMLETMAPAKPGAMKAKILALTGADDKFVPPDQVEQFKQEMKKAGADYQVIVYPGARHGFTNPEADAYAKQFDMPQLGYNAQADKQSWEEMQKFLNQIFKK